MKTRVRSWQDGVAGAVSSLTARFHAFDTCKGSPTDAAHRKGRLIEIHMSPINIFLSTLPSKTCIMHTTSCVIENSKDSFAQIHQPRSEHSKLLERMCLSSKRKKTGQAHSEQVKMSCRMWSGSRSDWLSIKLFYISISFYGRNTASNFPSGDGIEKDFPKAMKTLASELEV